MKFTSLVVVLLLGVSNAHGQQLPLTDDAWINGNSPNATFGDGNELFIHNFGPKSALVRFDTSSIAGASIASASLQFTVQSLRAAGTVTVRPVTSSWNESSVTWNSQPSVGQSLGIIGLNAGSAGTVVALDVTNLVQQWADGAAPPEGFLLSTDAGIRAFFGTREGGSGAVLEVTASGGPAPPVGEVLDLSNPPVVIAEQGDYRIDRDWFPDVPGGAAEATIIVRANSVRLDLGGFRIDGQGSGTVIRFEGNNFHLLDGAVGVTEGIPIQGTPDANRAMIEDISVGGTRDSALVAPGDANVLRRVRAGARGGVALGTNALIEFSEVSCAFHCVETGARAQVRGNTIDKFDFEEPGVSVGDDSLFIDNTVIFSALNTLEPGLAVEGNNTTVANNIFMFNGGDAERGVAIRVAGSGNLIDGNIVLRSTQNSPADVGIAFQADGNFYGDNRVDAEIAFDLAGTVQTDLGGNVEYARDGGGTL